MKSPTKEGLIGIEEMLATIAQVKGRKYYLGIMVLVNQYTSILSFYRGLNLKEKEKLNEVAALTSHIMVINIGLITEMITTEADYGKDCVACMEEVEKNFRSIIEHSYGKVPQQKEGEPE